MININQSEFDDNLRLTKAYCEFQMRLSGERSPAEALRSINPLYRGHPLFTLKKRYNHVHTDWHIDPLDIQSRTTYDDFFEIQLEHKKDFFADDELDYSPDGKILLTSIDGVIRDGISGMETVVL